MWLRSALAISPLCTEGDIAIVGVSRSLGTTPLLDFLAMSSIGATLCHCTFSNRISVVV